jgi:hypothetical protein
MALRKIPIAWVAATVMQPQRLEPDLDPALTRAWRRIPEQGGRALRSVFRPSGRDIVVVIVTLDRGARRWLP